FHSHAFMTKLSIFIAVALLSIIPTIEFLSWRKPVKAGELPVVSERKLRFVRSIIHGELGAVVIILLCAAIMARGGLVLRPSRVIRRQSENMLRMLKKNRPAPVSVRRHWPHFD